MLTNLTTSIQRENISINVKNKNNKNIVESLQLSDASFLGFRAFVHVILLCHYILNNSHVKAARNAIGKVVTNFTVNSKGKISQMNFCNIQPKDRLNFFSI